MVNLQSFTVDCFFGKLRMCKILQVPLPTCRFRADQTLVPTCKRPWNRPPDRKRDTLVSAKHAPFVWDFAQAIGTYPLRKNTKFIVVLKWGCINTRLCYQPRPEFKPTINTTVWNKVQELIFLLLVRVIVIACFAVGYLVCLSNAKWVAISPLYYQRQ